MRLVYNSLLQFILINVSQANLIVFRDELL